MSHEKVSPATTISRMNGQIAGQSAGTASLIRIAAGVLTRMHRPYARLLSSTLALITLESKHILPGIPCPGGREVPTGTMREGA